MLSVAIEGPCCAGKTTLGRGLLSELSHLAVAYVADYADYVGGGRFLPAAVPGLPAEEERALATFLAIEADRASHVRASASAWDLVLIDRSIHTLLAHCFGLDHVMAQGYFRLAEGVLPSSAIPLWPDLVLYLDLPQEVLAARNRGKFERDSIYVNAAFNEGARSYFQALASRGHPRVAWLDATVHAAELAAQARVQLDERIGATQRSTRRGT